MITPLTTSNRLLTQLAELHGSGPSGAARLIGDVADISRFASCGQRVR
jgi:hypothetical protein